MADLANHTATIPVYIDDFDPLFGYSNYDDWQTPDPSQHPTWYKEGENVTGMPWHQATYHQTTVQGAKAYLNFTGSSIYLYGAALADANISITLSSSSPSTAEYVTPTNATDNGRTTLYQKTGLADGVKQLVIENVGGGFLLDLAVVGAQVGVDGSSLTNTTLDETSSSIQYFGQWTSEDGDFYGGKSVYTQGPGNGFSFNFTGSTVYLFGDQVNDHGPYSVYLNGTQAANLNGRSGCGGGYAKTCEKLGGMRFFQTGLPMGTHNLTLMNEGPTGQNATFLDFDYAVFTEPSQYVAASNASTTSSTGTPSGTFASTPSASATTKTGAASHTMSSPAWLWGVLGALVLGRLARR